jgi:hypothetical protein
MNYFATEIDGISVSNEIVKTNFFCDFDLCKGACCTMNSAYGAPVHESEITVIENILPKIKIYLSDRNWNYIKKYGFWEEKEEIPMIKSIENKDCVFTYFEGEIARCSIEKAYNDRKIEFIKPLSCHLFPIRVSDFGGPVLRYEEYSECKSALVKGRKLEVNIIDFCKISLERAFGEQWFIKLKERLEK